MDNDGDGQTDSVWVDLGYPARRNAQGQLYKPLFAFMVIGLNGRIPLNTAGNLAGGRGHRRRPTRRTWATRSARSTRRTGSRTRSYSTTDARGGVHAPGLRRSSTRPTRGQQPGRQRRRRRPPDPAPQPAGRHAAAGQPQGVPGLTPGAADLTGRSTATTTSSLIERHRPTSCPTASPTSSTWTSRQQPSRPTPLGFRADSARGGAVGRGPVGARLPELPNPNAPAPSSTWSAATYNNPIRAGYSLDIGDLAQRHAPRRGRRQSELLRPLPADSATRQPAGRGRRPRLPTIPPGPSSSPSSGCGGT